MPAVGVLKQSSHLCVFTLWASNLREKPPVDVFLAFSPSSVLIFWTAFISSHDNFANCNGRSRNIITTYLTKILPQTEPQYKFTCESNKIIELYTLFKTLVLMSLNRIYISNRSFSNLQKIVLPYLYTFNFTSYACSLCRQRSSTWPIHSIPHLDRLNEWKTWNENEDIKIVGIFE